MLIVEMLEIQLFVNMKSVNSGWFGN
jgi:hypothetical protein